MKAKSIIYEGKDVPDPYFFDGFEGYDKVYEMMHEINPQKFPKIYGHGL